MPRARVGHIGLQRDEETAAASRYYSRLPPGLAASVVLLVDPMLATGGSAVAAVDIIKAAGVRAIRMMCVVAAPEGVAAMTAAHPDVHVYSPALDTAAERPQVHRAGARRLRRSAVRDDLTT